MVNDEVYTLLQEYDKQMDRLWGKVDLHEKKIHVLEKEVAKLEGIINENR